MSTQRIMDTYPNYNKLIMEIKQENEALHKMMSVAQCDSERLLYLEAMQKNSLAINKLAKERMELTLKELS